MSFSCPWILKGETKLETQESTRLASLSWTPAFAPVKVTAILNEKKEQEIAYRRSKNPRDRHDKGKDWADMLDNQLAWDIVRDDENR